MLLVKKLLQPFWKEIAKKVIRKKDDKLLVKLKGYDSSFNSGMNKKDIV